MALNEMKHLSDITVPEGVEIVELSHGEGHDQPIVSIQMIKVVEIEEPEEEAVEGEEAAEGEAPAEDAAAAEAPAEGGGDGETKED